MALNLEQLADLIQATNELDIKGKWIDLSRDVQSYVAWNRIFKKKRYYETGGSQIQWRVKVGSTGSAKVTAPYQPDSPKVADMFQTASIPFRMTQTDYTIEEAEEALNRGPNEVLKLLTARRIDAMGDLAELFEQLFWADHDASATNDPYGIQYYLVNNATEGFNGAAPTGETTVAGLNPKTYSTWKNYTGNYAAVSKADLITMIRAALTKCNFLPPVQYPSMGEGVDCEMFAPYSVIKTMEDLLEAQNDNLGNDLASKDGRVMIRGNPVIWVPALDGDSTISPTAAAKAPILGINWRTIRVPFQTGWFSKQSAPVRAPYMHRAMTVFVDNMYNVMCTNRRSNFRLQTA